MVSFFSCLLLTCCDLGSPLRHPRRRLTIGGVNGSMELIEPKMEKEEKTKRSPDAGGG